MSSKNRYRKQNVQNYNKYGYVTNNPLLYNDPSGEFVFLVPILAKVFIGAVYGAVIGAGVAAVTYSIKGLITGNWTLNGFGKAILGGAISGALSGGFNGLGASLFSTGRFMLNSGTWDFMTNMITGFIQEGKIDLKNIGASIIGSFVGNRIPGWKRIKGKGFGGWIKNSVGEVLHSSLKYGITGAISGGFNSLFRGENVWKGMKQGFENGVYNGAGQAVFMVGVFGATYKPTDEQLKYVKKMSEKYGVDYKNVKWRKGGLYQLLQPLWSGGFNREVVWGNNVATFSNTDANTLGHEFGHIIQVRQQGWSNFQAKGIWEQIYVNMIKGIDPYTTRKEEGNQYNEYDAEQKLREINK
ncbi:MAG: hypothetical protein ACTTJM_06570 [Bergeyella cardium]